MTSKDSVNSFGARDTTLNAFRKKYSNDFIRYWSPFEEGMTELIAQDSDPGGSNTGPESGNPYAGYVSKLRDKFKAEPASRAVFLKAYYSGNIPDAVFSWVETTSFEGPSGP